MFETEATSIKVPRGGVVQNFEVAAALAGRKTTQNDVPSVGELRSATLTWFQENKKEMTLPKLVVQFDKKGWVVLFTPPYCPDLQPIELFWATGKNRARAGLNNRALDDDRNRSIKETVADLRVGWYGDGEDIAPCNCAGLVRTAIKKANERVAYDEFISGDVESGITVASGCELRVGVDEIGRATRVLCRRAASGDLSAAEENGTATRGDGGDSDSDSDSDDDDDGE